MQAAKDTFYVALRDRLVQCDPNLTITIDGATRPAIVVLENEIPASQPLQNDAFYLEWGGVRSVRPDSSGLLAMDCLVYYTSAGQQDTGGVGRGRDLGKLDGDLLTMCSPPQAHKYDYSTGSAVDLGSYIFWSLPELKPAKAGPTQVGREAHVTVYFYPEVTQQ